MYIKKIYGLMTRNSRLLNGEKTIPDVVNLEYWQDKTNLGDQLAPIIYEWMLKRKGIDSKQKIKKTVHLMTVGSIITMGRCDAIIWGSGILNFQSIIQIARKKMFRAYDVRAVRGPLTREIMLSVGYKCPEIYGDPGVLMPLIYKPVLREETRGKTVVILHFSEKDKQIPEGCVKLNIQTSDYQSFLDSLVSAEKVISSSLHGIILAESYGIPAVFVSSGIENEMLKFYDWYYSTKRQNVRMAHSVEEALEMIPMDLPSNIEELQTNLINSFPYDLWYT